MADRRFRRFSCLPENGFRIVSSRVWGNNQLQPGSQALAEQQDGTYRAVDALIWRRAEPQVHAQPHRMERPDVEK